MSSRDPEPAPCYVLSLPFEEGLGLTRLLSLFAGAPEPADGLDRTAHVWTNVGIASYLEDTVAHFEAWGPEGTLLLEIAAQTLTLTDPVLHAQALLAGPLPDQARYALIATGYSVPERVAVIGPLSDREAELIQSSEFVSDLADLMVPLGLVPHTPARRPRFLGIVNNVIGTPKVPPVPVSALCRSVLLAEAFAERVGTQAAGADLEPHEEAALYQLCSAVALRAKLARVVQEVVA